MTEFEPIVVKADVAVLDEAVNAQVKTEIVAPSDITIEPLTATENGTYTPPSGKTYGSAVVNVPTRESDLQKLIDRTITSIEIPSGNTRIGDHSFCNCALLESVIIPDSVTVIGTAAFQSSGLLSVDIPDSVTSIGTNCFSGCRSLVSANLPDNIQTLPIGVFNNCVALLSISIPQSVRDLRANVLSNCIGMQSIKFAKETPPSVLANTFTNLPTNCVIHVPYSEDHSILNAYKTAANYPDPNIYSYVEDS